RISFGTFLWARVSMTSDGWEGWSRRSSTGVFTLAALSQRGPGHQARDRNNSGSVRRRAHRQKQPARKSSASTSWGRNRSSDRSQTSLARAAAPGRLPAAERRRNAFLPILGGKVVGKER